VDNGRPDGQLENAYAFHLLLLVDENNTVISSFGLKEYATSYPRFHPKAGRGSTGPTLLVHFTAAVAAYYNTLHHIIVTNVFKEQTSITLQELNAIENISFQSTFENGYVADLISRGSLFQTEGCDDEGAITNCRTSGSWNGK